MEEITEFIGRAAAVAAFCSALAFALFEIRLMEAIQAAEPAARLFRIII
jgi:hypothetical protein